MADAGVAFPGVCRISIPWALVANVRIFHKPYFPNKTKGCTTNFPFVMLNAMKHLLNTVESFDGFLTTYRNDNDFSAILNAVYSSSFVIVCPRAYREGGNGIAFVTR